MASEVRLTGSWQRWLDTYSSARPAWDRAEPESREAGTSGQAPAVGTPAAPTGAPSGTGLPREHASAATQR